MYARKQVEMRKIAEELGAFATFACGRCALFQPVITTFSSALLLVDSQLLKPLLHSLRTHAHTRTHATHTTHTRAFSQPLSTSLLPKNQRKTSKAVAVQTRRC